MRQSPQRKQERERVRQTLMRATLDLAESHGFSGLGLREISREAGIAPTSFYRHFADVEELGLGIIERLVGPLLDGIAKTALAAPDPLESVVRGLLDAAVADPPLVRFVLSQHSGAHASFRRALRARFEVLLEVLRPVLPGGAPHLAPAAVLAGILLGCEEVLEADSKDRAALSATLKPPLAEATRWLLHRPAAGEGGHG